jgi:ATP-dependent helicase HrpA
VLSATLLDTERVWALTNAASTGLGDQRTAAPARTRHHDPHWARRRARGRQRTDQPVRAGARAERPVHYGACFPEEAGIFAARVRWLTGEINTRCAPSCRATFATLAKARRKEAKQRRAGLVVDEEWMAQRYLDRLPPHVHNAQALDAWYNKLPAGRRRRS